ncbi:MAG TPA: TerB family tellurite resistance protein [Longimicrobiales bacterium]|nr:TerB family tellurite resistance protein [Longimicrobiales bacterium]
MLDALKRLLGGAPAPETPPRPEAPAGVDPLHLAACALLLEVAHADGEFSPEERAHLEDVLERHFGLPADSGRELLALAEAERRSATDQYRFTSVLQEGYDLGQKMVLAEVMWGLVLADGEIAEHEQYMTRQIANLLDLKPGYLSRAKQAAAERAP